MIILDAKEGISPSQSPNINNKLNKVVSCALYNFILNSLKRKKKHIILEK